MKFDIYRHARTGANIHVPAGSAVPKEFYGEPLRLILADWEDSTPETIQAIARQGWRKTQGGVFFNTNVVSHPPI